MKPENVTRISQIAMEIEPIPNKVGLTTRYEDKVDTLKLELHRTLEHNNDHIVQGKWKKHADKLGVKDE